MDASRITSSSVPPTTLSPDAAAGDTTTPTQNETARPPRKRTLDMIGDLPRQTHQPSAKRLEQAQPSQPSSGFRTVQLPASVPSAVVQAQQPLPAPARISLPFPQQSVEPWLPGDVYDNAHFTSRSIRDYAQEQLGLPKDTDVVAHLFNALPEDQQTEPNRALLEQAMQHSVNASGAAMMMVNTDAGLQLVAANSQRRKIVIQSNGACEKGESIRETVRREFKEELGNPDPKGILLGTLSEANLRAVNGLNTIGNTAAEIAARIVKVNAKPGSLFLNVTSLFANREPVPMTALQEEVSLLNERLARAKPFYQEAVHFIYGEGKEAFQQDAQARGDAANVIKRFKEACPDNITESFAQCFDAVKADGEDDMDALKEALMAIIDLAENDEIKLIGESTFADAMRLATTMDSDESAKAALKKDYFAIAFVGGAQHMGATTPEAFMEQLKAGAMAPAIGAPVGGPAGASQP
ncbi:NUDIX hydrolase (plasmid) [Ralstonia syzygii]|uniref:NUDIX hydrolase n=1 Tax=Ralstonia syzygii TaxID=28097 RepID=A0ABX7ZMV8_9RALS|nr:NUDIX domain-containing protein [Ralstonia syzygii]QUP56803.1 NUDIX hydrolase [Ralstonia syzygii]